MACASRLSRFGVFAAIKASLRTPSQPINNIFFWGSTPWGHSVLISFLGLNLLLYFYCNELKIRGILNIFSLLGKASFIFYITHMYLIQKFTSLLDNYNSFFIIYSCIWLISLMLYVLVEVPLNRLSNFIFKKYHS